MTPAEFYVNILTPSMAGMPSILDTPLARLMLLAVAGQESAWTDRIQVPGGQARGFWQCEQGGMLAGVLNGPYAPVLQTALGLYSIPTSPAQVFEALAWHDHIAALVARLGLFMDPAKLPAPGDLDDAWTTYLRVWRPGKPSRVRWGVVYPQALAVVRA